jgi:BMFP domain-containing protein YqiC
MDQVAQVDLVVQEEVDTAAKVAIHNRIKETLKSQE